jgi:hypothetical protein
LTWAGVGLYSSVHLRLEIDPTAEYGLDPNMKSRRFAAAAGAIAIVGLGALTAACGSNSTESPSTTTTTTTTSTTAPSATPTEKGLDPTGGNKFSPSVLAPPPATAIPGDN